MRGGAGAHLAAAAVLLLAGCGTTPADPADATLSAACAAPEPQTVQGGSHLLGTTEPPVPYTSDPGTSGWHSSGGGPAAGAHASGVTEPDQVAVLERGGVVLAFDPELAPTAAGALLELGATLTGDVVVTPHVRGLPTPVTLTGWGLLARCDAGVTADDVATFASLVAPPGGH